MMFSKLAVGRGFMRAKGRDASLFSTLAKLAFWSVALGCISWIVFDWLRDAFATPAQIASAQPRTTVDLDRAIAAAAGAAIFGEAALPAVVPKADADMPEIKLKGVFAGGAGPVAAIVNRGGQDESVLLNQSLGPGVVLQGVYPSHIEISRNGVTRRVELETLKSEPSEPKSAAHSVSKHPLRGESAIPPDSAGEAAPPSSPMVPAGDTPSVAPEVQPTAPLAPPMQHSRWLRDALPETQFSATLKYPGNLGHA